MQQQRVLRFVDVGLIALVVPIVAAAFFVLGSPLTVCWRIVWFGLLHLGHASVLVSPRPRGIVVAMLVLDLIATTLRVIRFVRVQFAVFFGLGLLPFTVCSPFTNNEAARWWFSVLLILRSAAFLVVSYIYYNRSSSAPPAAPAGARKHVRLI